MTRQTPEYIKVACPYCRAGVGEGCRVIHNRYIATRDSPCFDNWGRRTVHAQRVVAANAAALARVVEIVTD